MSNAPERSPSKEFDWNTSPLSDAQSRLADLKKIYERALGIVSQRQSKVPVVWKCWTQSHRREVPKGVVAQCKGIIPDGKWLFKNDGDVDSNGHGTVCCSQLCYQIYSQNLSVKKYQAKLLVAGEEGGNLPAETNK